MAAIRSLTTFRIALPVAGLFAFLLCSPITLADETGSQSPLPKLKSTGGPAYYPDKAKQIGAEGRALLAFNISRAGRPTGITVESSDGSKLLSNFAVAILKGDVFDLSETPEIADSVNTRYHMSFVFELAPCGKLQHYDVPKNAKTSICASPLH